MSSHLETTPLVILAGGKATRLKELSRETPKYLMPISDTLTFADLHLNWAYSQGFRKVFLSIGHLGDQIMNYCGDGSKYDLQIKYFDDGPLLLGTGGAVKKTLRDSYSYVAITYGDTLLRLNVRKMFDHHLKNKALATMSFYKNEVPGHQCNINVVDPSSSKIIYNKKQPNNDWKYIDYGFMFLNRKLVEDFSNNIPLDLSEPLSFASDEGRVYGYECHDRFWEIGSPEALLEFQNNHK